MPMDGLSESALEPRAAAKREGCHFREVPDPDMRARIRPSHSRSATSVWILNNVAQGRFSSKSAHLDQFRSMPELNTM